MLANKGSRYTEGVAETSLTICRLFDYLLTIPVNCNALKTLHPACMGKCHELYPCLEQVQHSFTEYKSYMYMFKSLSQFNYLRMPLVEQELLILPEKMSSPKWASKFFFLKSTPDIYVILFSIFPHNLLYLHKLFQLSNQHVWLFSSVNWMSLI